VAMAELDGVVDEMLQELSNANRIEASNHGRLRFYVTRQRRSRMPGADYLGHFCKAPDRSVALATFGGRGRSRAAWSASVASAPRLAGLGCGADGSMESESAAGVALAVCCFWLRSPRSSHHD
jgi:hypothetical protein